MKAKQLAQTYYDVLERTMQLCATEPDNAECAQLVESRIKFDQQLEVLNNKQNATKIFFVFAVFVPMVVWAGFFLTHAVFRDEHKGGRDF